MRVNMLTSPRSQQYLSCPLAYCHRVLAVAISATSCLRSPGYHMSGCCFTVQEFVQRMPGASLSGGFATGAAATGGHGPPKQTRKRRPPRKPAAPRRDVVERASSPLAIPGVEIHVDGLLYEVPHQSTERHSSGVCQELASPLCCCWFLQTWHTDTVIVHMTAWTADRRSSLFDSHLSPVLW